MGRLIPYIYSMDQYLLIPFLVGWTSINPSYFDVNYRGTIGFDTLPYIFNCFNHLQKYECQWEGLFHIYMYIYNIYIYMTWKIKTCLKPPTRSILHHIRRIQQHPRCSVQQPGPNSQFTSCSGQLSQAQKNDLAKWKIHRFYGKCMVNLW